MRDLIQGLFSSLGTVDFFAFILHQDILTTRLPAFLMQYHERSYSRLIFLSWYCRFLRFYITPGYSYNEAPSFSYAIPWENLIQGLYSGLVTTDSLAIISYHDILTTRLPAFLMQYHERILFKDYTPVLSLQIPSLLYHHDILTTRLPAFLMQYHDRVIYPKLRTLRNVFSKV